MSEVSTITPPPDLLAKGLEAAQKRAELFSSKSAEIVTNNDASGRDNAGTIAKSQIKIGDGNTNPDAGLHSSIATPPEAIPVAPQKPGVPADSEPKTKSKSKPKGKKVLPLRRAIGRTTPKTPKVAPVGIAHDPAIVSVEPAVSPEPVITDGVEKEKNERMQAVNNAKTPEELCDIVASFDAVPSIKSGDTTGAQLAKWMRNLLSDSNRQGFDTYEEFEKEWKKAKKTITKAYGIQERFDTLLREKMRLEFAEPLPQSVSLQEEEKKNTSERWTAFMESVKDGESIVLANGADRTEWINIQRVGDSWFSVMADVKKTTNDITVDVRNKVEAGWVVDSEHSSPDDVLKKWGTSEAEMKERVKIESEIKVLEGELDVLRRKYAQKDYEETSVWQRLSRVFNKKLESKETTDEKIKYQEKLRELRSKRLDAVMKSGKEGNVLKHAMAEEIQYFKIQANNELYAAWTDAEAERKGLSEKILDFGRKYNKLPLWKKIAIGSAVLGVAGAAAGGLLGAYGIASATVLAGVKRGVAAGGLFATLEAWHEKKSRESFGDTKENRTKNLDQVEKMMEESQSLEDRMAKLKEFIERDFESIDQNLASRVGNRDGRRFVDFSGAIGASFGLVAALDYLHGTESVSTGEASGAAKEASTAAKAAAESEAPGPEKGREWMLKPKQLQGASQASADVHASATPASPGVVAEAAKTAVEAPKPAGTALAEHTKLIDTFVNQDIRVAKGDSVWKISGRLADQMKLTGGARTHFIDAIKDKFGDVQLQEGKTINLSAKGIDQEFIEKALGKSGLLTAEQLSSIEANDAKIAEFARANPGVTLTNESVDTLLHAPSSTGVASEVAHGSRVQLPPQGFTGVPADNFAPSIESSTSTPGVSAESISPPVSPAEAPFERPSLTEMRRGSDWYMQIFRMDDQMNGKDWVFDKEGVKGIMGTKISDILKVESNGSVSVVENSNLNPAQSENFRKFVSELPKIYPDDKVSLSDFFRAKPDISVSEYLARMAKHVPQGTRIGLYTTTN